MIYSILLKWLHKLECRVRMAEFKSRKKKQEKRCGMTMARRK